jgi:PadR family transcriptional regulator PadR
MSGKDDQIELLQGTLDLIVLRSLSTMGPLHAYALAERLAQVSDHPLSLNQGTLYPALIRLEQKGWIKGAWGKTGNNREAKFYSITRSGERELTKQAERWRRLAGLVDKLLTRLIATRGTANAFQAPFHYTIRHIFPSVALKPIDTLSAE